MIGRACCVLHKDAFETLTKARFRKGGLGPSCYIIFGLLFENRQKRSGGLGRPGRSPAKGKPGDRPLGDLRFWAPGGIGLFRCFSILYSCFTYVLVFSNYLFTSVGYLQRFCTLLEIFSYEKNRMVATVYFICL